MWDLAEDPNSVMLIESFLAAGKPIALVCHAPGVLRHVKTPSGKPLVEGKKVTGFTNGEEADVGLTKVVPFLVEDEPTSPRRNLLQGQKLGCLHGQGRPPDHWPKPGIVRSGRRSPDRHSKGMTGRARHQRGAQGSVIGASRTMRRIPAIVLLSEPTAGTQPCWREPLFMPEHGHSERARVCAAGASSHDRKIMVWKTPARCATL
jgi:hypothetical protein